MVDADKSLANIAGLWHNVLSSSKLKVNAPETSRCYLQVGSGNAVQDKAICGPVHFVGEDKSAWQALSLSVGPGYDDIQKAALYPAPKATFATDTPLPNAQLVLADGTVGDPKQEVPPPDLPAAAGGAVYPSISITQGKSGTQQAAATPVRVRAPGRSYSVAVNGPVTSVDSGGGNWVKAPEGGGFYTLTLSDTWSSSSSDEVGEDLHWRVSSAGQSWDLAVPPHSNQSMGTASNTFTVVVPKAEDATLDVSSGDLKQQIRLKDRGRVTGGTADGYYLGYPTGEQACPSSPRDAAYVLSCTVKVSRTAYDPTTKKWASPGRMIVLVTIGTYAQMNGPKESSGYTPSYSIDSTAVTDVVLGGATPLSSRPIKGGLFQADSTEFVFEVPIDDSVATPVTFKVTSKGTLNSSFITTSAPKTSTQTYDGNVSVPMTKASG